MVADKSDTPINRIGETHLSGREGQRRGWIEAGNEPSTVSKEKSGKLFRDVFSSLRPFWSRFLGKRGPAFVRKGRSLSSSNLYGGERGIFRRLSGDWHKC